MPPARDKKIKLVFETMIQADTQDGVNFSIQVNGKTVYSEHQLQKTGKSHNVDLTEYASQKINLVFSVNKNENIANDWFYWVNPLLIYE